MSGYRQSGFDPNAAWGEPGPPLRPYNWVQWTGVGFIVLGIAFVLAYFAQRAHLIGQVLDGAAPGAMLCLIGSTLVNSRRREIPEADRAEYREKLRRRTYIALGVALLAAITGFAAAYFSHGA